MQESSTTQRLLENWARWIVILAVVVSPWLIGGAEPWAYLLIGGAVNVGGILWLLSMLCGHPNRLNAQVTTMFLGGLLLVVLLQIVPLPKGVVESISPRSAELTTISHDLFSDMAPPHDYIEHIDLTNAPYALSVAPATTSRSLFLFIAYLLCFLVMANTIRGWAPLRRIATLLVINSALIAFVGIIHKYSGASDILWVHTPRFGGNVFGPFTNRNHFAAYTNLSLGLALGVLFSSKPFIEMTHSADWRDRLAWLSSKSASSIALSGFMIVLLSGSVCVSQSRGGMLSMAVSILILGFYISWRRRDLGRTRIAMLAACFLIATAVLWLGRGHVVNRLATLSDVIRNPMQDLRAIVTLDTLHIFLAFPVFGSGFGTFRHIFSEFQTPSLDLRWLHAHNDWAQLLAEGGVAATLFFTSALLAWAGGLFKRFKTCASRSRLLISGMCVGFGTIAMHSLIDYSLHKPAIACQLATMAGMAVAASNIRSRRFALDLEDEAKATRLLSQGAIKAIALLCILGLSISVNAKRADFRSELAFTRFKYLGRLGIHATSGEEAAMLAARALRESEIIMLNGQGNPDALAEISRDLIQWSLNPLLDRPVRVRQSLAASSSGALAAYLAPTDYLPWLSLARTLMAVGQWDASDACLTHARGLVRHGNQVRMFNVEELPADQVWEDVRRRSPKEKDMHR